MAQAQLLAQLEARRNFLTPPGERVLFAQRKHWYMLLLRVCSASALGIFLGLFTIVLFLYLIPSVSFLLTTLLSLFVITFGLILKATVDWYCHFYVVTTKKILEVCISPLFTNRINDILLDQVRCTEVDVQRNGFFAELFDVGDIVITFDRPTHQQEFVIAGIEKSEDASIFLSEILVGQAKTEGDNPIWFRDKQKEKFGFRFTQEIFPGEVAGVN